jgi:hypothetical protein
MAKGARLDHTIRPELWSSLEANLLVTDRVIDIVTEAIDGGELGFRDSGLSQLRSSDRSRPGRTAFESMSPESVGSESAPAAHVLTHRR